MKRISDAVTKINLTITTKPSSGEVVSKYHRPNFGKLFGNKQPPAQALGTAPD